MEQSKGTLPIALLAEKSCLSKRQFERRFINDVGISPKTFSRVIKFSNECCFLNEEPKKSLFETAIDCGYYDHAHLIKEFKSLSGLSPAEF